MKILADKNDSLEEKFRYFEDRCAVCSSAPSLLGHVIILTAILIDKCNINYTPLNVSWVMYNKLWIKQTLFGGPVDFVVLRIDCTIFVP